MALSCARGRVGFNARILDLGSRMILSASTLPAMVLQSDIAVIGRGASGLALASRLNRDAVVIDGAGFDPNSGQNEHFMFETTALAMNRQLLRRRLVGGASVLWSGRCAPLDRVDPIAKPGANRAAG